MSVPDAVVDDERPVLFDAHLHIIDDRFPLRTNQGYRPSAFTVDDYRARTRDLAVAGGAVVSGSFQGFDQSYLLDALSRLGPDFVGVTQLPPDATDAQIRGLDAAGVRAVRVNVVRGASITRTELDRQARRVHDLVGWHTEIYLDARELPGLHSTLAALPAVSIDHLGLHADGLPHLLRLVETGAKVKATGFGRVELDPATAIAAVAALDPAALLVGTDLPSTRARRAFDPDDLALIARTVPPADLERVMWSNAADFYRIPRRQP